MVSCKSRPLVSTVSSIMLPYHIMYYIILWIHVKCKLEIFKECRKFKFKRASHPWHPNADEIDIYSPSNDAFDGTFVLENIGSNLPMVISDLIRFSLMSRTHSNEYIIQSVTQIIFKNLRKYTTSFVIGGCGTQGLVSTHVTY